MKKLTSALLVSTLFVSLTVHAAGVLKVKESVEINAPAAKVWALAGDFGNLGAFHPAVAKTDIVEGTNNVKGAKRILTLQDGGTVNETLTAFSAKKTMMSYIITESVLPVSDYSATIKVIPMGKAKSKVVWNAAFKRADQAATPAEGKDDATATKTITGVFRGGLDNLKKLSETN
jgi:mxaD protein